MHVVRATDLTSFTSDGQIALNHVDLTIEKGSVFGLAGPHGAGKTTLLRLILGLSEPSDGALLVLGEPIGVTRADLRRRIGFAAADPALPEHLTPLRFLEFTGELAGISRRAARRRLARLIEQLELHEQGHERIASASIAVRRRLAIAAALMSDPEILLLDEPATGLAPDQSQRVIELLRELSGPDRTIVITSRRLDDLERICTDLGVLSWGRLIYQGPAASLTGMARQTFVRVEVDGHIAAFEQALEAIDDTTPVLVERAGTTLAITCLGPHPRAAYVHAIVEAAEASGVELLRLDASGGEIGERYLERLAADRTDGSLRTAAWAASQATEPRPLFEAEDQ